MSNEYPEAVVLADEGEAPGEGRDVQTRVDAIEGRLNALQARGVVLEWVYDPRTSTEDGARGDQGPYWILALPGRMIETVLNEHEALAFLLGADMVSSATSKTHLRFGNPAPTDALDKGPDDFPMIGAGKGRVDEFRLWAFNHGRSDGAPALAANVAAEAGRCGILTLDFRSIYNEEYWKGVTA